MTTAWDRYDFGEVVGLAGVVAFCWVTFGWHWAVLAASLVLLVEVQLRSRGRSPVRATPARRRLVAVARAARTAWAESDAA
jgi:hypothetical protein